MSSLVIIVKSPDTATTLRSQLLKQAGAGSQQAALLSTYFHAIAGGVKSAAFRVSTGTANPVAASGTLTLTYASIVANDTMIIGKTTLTWVTGAPANESQVRKITDLTTTAENLVVAINAHSVLSKVVTATRSAGVVTIACKVQGEIGNQLPLSSSSAGAVASASYLASGAGGALDTPVDFARGF